MFTCRPIRRTSQRATHLGNFTQPNVPVLGTGESYTQMRTVTLPKGIGTIDEPIDYYIHIFISSGATLGAAQQQRRKSQLLQVARFRGSQQQLGHSSRFPFSIENRICS